MAAIFPDNDLKIFDYNRAVKDLNGNSSSEFLDKVKAADSKLRIWERKYIILRESMCSPCTLTEDGTGSQPEKR